LPLAYYWWQTRAPEDRRIEELMVERKDYNSLKITIQRI